MCDLKDAMKDGNSIYDIDFPGNFSSDAEFFVFTGVFAWLYCFARFESTKWVLPTGQCVSVYEKCIIVPFSVWLSMCSSTTYMLTSKRTIQR